MLDYLDAGKNYMNMIVSFCSPMLHVLHSEGFWLIFVAYSMDEHINLALQNIRYYGVK